jgi:hypothetical protein
LSVPKHGDFFILAGLLGAILLSKIGKTSLDRLERESEIQMVAEDFFERQLQEKLLQSGASLAQVESFIDQTNTGSNLANVDRLLAELAKLVGMPQVNVQAALQPAIPISESYSALPISVDQASVAISVSQSDQIALDPSEFDYSFAESEGITLTLADSAIPNKDEKESDVFSEQDSSLTELDESVTQIAEVDPTGSFYGSPVAGSGGGGGGAAGASTSSSSASVASNFSGSVIDGYVSGATVFSDLDGDLALDWLDGDGDKIWDLGEGEVWATTDSLGAYTFNTAGNVSGKIISLGGTDVTTGSAITMLQASAGSAYVTPISTAYVYAEAGTAGAGATLLASMGLSTADLTYDPTTSTAANADAVLTIGASMLSVVNSAATLASSIGGSGTTAAAATVFAEMAKLSGSDLAKLTGSDSSLVGGVLTTLMNSTLTSVGIDASSYSTAVNAASASTASVSAAVRGLSSAAIRSGELAQLAKAGQETLIADVKALAAAAASGDDISAKVTALSSNYASSNMATLKTAAAQKLAFNRSDPSNPITTTADSFTIEAPAGGVAVTKLFNPLANDSLKGGGTLTLAAVGLFDPRSNSGKIATLAQNTITLGDKASSDNSFYNGMSIVVLTANGPLNGTIATYDGATRTATLKPILTFTSKSTNPVDVTDLTKSGTGTVSIETSQGSASARETATVTFSDLVAGSTLTLDGLTYTAPSGGASANTVAQFFASKDLSLWSTGTAKSLFGQDPVVVPPNADYLISNALPPNIQLGIENNQIKVINSYNRDSQFGSYDLIYVTAKSDDPTIAKTGLATINVLPPAPTISQAGVTSLTFTSKSSGDVTDLANLGNGKVIIETKQGAANTKEFATVTFFNLVAGEQVKLDGETFTAPVGGASANTVAQFFASKDLSLWSTAKTYLVAEAVNESVTAAYTLVNLPLNVQGLGLDGQIQIRGLPAGSILKVMSGGQEISINGRQILANGSIVNTVQGSDNPTSTRTETVEIAFFPVTKGEKLKIGNKSYEQKTDPPTANQVADFFAKDPPSGWTVSQNGSTITFTSTAPNQDVTDLVSSASVWTLSGPNAIAADYATLKALIPADLAAEYALTILASSRYAGLSTTVKDTATVVVTPTTDGLRIEPSDISGINKELNDFVPDAVNEDTQFEFQKLLNNENPIKAFLDTAARKLIDTGSEKLGLRIELAEGFIGTFTQTNLATRSGSAGDGKTYVEVFDAAAPGMPTLQQALESFRITPQTNFSGNASLVIKIGSFESGLAVGGLPPATGAGSLKLFSTSFSAPLSVTPVADGLSISGQPQMTNLSTLIGAAIPKTLTEDVSFNAFTGTSQVAALVNLLQAARVDDDGSDHGSERLFLRIELPSGFALPYSSTNPFNIPKYLMTFTSKSLGDVIDLNNSGTGTVGIEISQGSASARETATVTFSDLVAGRTLKLGGLSYTAPDGGASANTVAQFFASKDLTGWTTSLIQKDIIDVSYRSQTINGKVVVDIADAPFRGISAALEALKVIPKPNFSGEVTFKVTPGSYEFVTGQLFSNSSQSLLASGWIFQGR